MTSADPIFFQKRLVEVGRIRLGEKRTSKNGKSYPAKLDRFRLTSRDKQRLDAAALLYGGEVKAWEDEWELLTFTDTLPIAIIPGQALKQSMELWGQKNLPGGKKSAVICLRKCDGVTEKNIDGPCICQGEEEMACKPTSRLSVMLLDIIGLGVWRLDSHGWNAASELGGSVQLLERLVSAGRPVRARLRLDKREQKTETETRQFVVPVIDIDATLGQVLDTIGGGQIERAPQPAIESRGFTPVPELPAPAPSITEQLDARPEKRARANAAEPIRGSGRAHSGAQVAGPTEEPAQAPSEPAGDGGSQSTEPPDPPSPSTEDDPQRVQRAQQVAIWIGELNPDDDFRHHFLEAFSEGRYASAKDVPVADLAMLRAQTVRYRKKLVQLAESPGGGWVFEPLGIVSPGPPA